MSFQGYISYPITVEASTILSEAYDFIKTKVPEWMEHDGNLDTWILQVTSSQAADLMALAADVPDTIFKWYGANLVGVPPLDATAATVDSTWTVADTQGYTIPAGSMVAIRDTSGVDHGFITSSDIIIPAGQTSTAVGAVTLMSVETGEILSGLGGAGVVVPLVDTLTFVNTVTLTGETAGGQDAELSSEYNERLARKLQRLSQRPILASDFSLAALDVDGVERAVAIDGYNPNYNQLAANEATVETDATAWAVGANCTVTSSSAQAADGAKSLAIASTSAATCSAVIVAAARENAAPNDLWTAIASFRALSNPRSVQVLLYFYDSGGTLISASTVTGTAVTDSNTGWTSAYAMGVAPATAAKVGMALQIVSPANGETHFADAMSLHKGTGTTYGPAGTSELNNERYVGVAAIDANGQPVNSTIKANLGAYLDSQRETNFVVPIFDPYVTPISVTYNVKCLLGYTAASVKQACDDALNRYFDPSIWGTDPSVTDASASAQTWVETSIVYYWKVIQVLDSVQGVDRVISMTMGIQGQTLGTVDVTLPGRATLAKVGVLTGTATP
jgi:hypothetical protein